MKYRKKPVIVEAMQWMGTNTDAMLGFVLGKTSIRFVGPVSSSQLVLIVETLEGDMRANHGDWVICGVKGEYYPCKPDIFLQTYEPVK